MFSNAAVIQRLLDLFEAPKYLEIGVDHGDTFMALRAARKVGVDPRFNFDARSYASSSAGVECHEVPSDHYFDSVAESSDKFDVIFLDGLHVAEQTLRDLINALCLLKSSGVIVIDDVIPNSYHASLADTGDLIRVREFLTVRNPHLAKEEDWMGDVYKLPFFIDSFMQQLSYATILENRGQTVVWHQRRLAREVGHRSLEQIARLEFKDLIRAFDVLRLTPFDKIVELVSAAIHAPRQVRDGSSGVPDRNVGQEFWQIQMKIGPPGVT